MAGTIEIETEASDRGLLTVQELRAITGPGPTDEELTAIGLTVSDQISNWCKIASDGQLPPTLLQEKIVETIADMPDAKKLTLARRFLAPGIVVESAGQPLAEGTDYTVQRWAGVLTRKSSWRYAGPLKVTYEAGFVSDKIPLPLKDVARKMVARRTGQSRDPLMQSQRVDIPGVRMVEQRYWVDTSESALFTPDMQDTLRDYETFSVG